MNQHQIRIMNYPEPTSDEQFVQKSSKAHALARQWSETALSSGLEGLLHPGDRPALRDLIKKARRRALLSADGREAVAWLADRCANRILQLGHHDAPATRARAGLLTNQELELRALACALDEVLDLEAAVRAWRRIDREAAQPAEAEAAASNGLRPVAFPGDELIESDKAPPTRSWADRSPGARQA